MRILLILNLDFGFGSKGLSVSLLVKEIWSVEVNSLGCQPVFGPLWVLGIKLRQGIFRDF